VSRASEEDRQRRANFARLGEVWRDAINGLKERDKQRVEKPRG